MPDPSAYRRLPALPTPPQRDREDPHGPLLSMARLEVLAQARGPDRMRQALRRFAACLEEDGDALLMAIARGAQPDIRRRAMLLEGVALEIGGRVLARLCAALKEDPASDAARAGLGRLPAVLGDTLRAARALADAPPGIGQVTGSATGCDRP